MHILIIPSERYLPPGMAMSGIFQQHQAIALHRSGHRVGIVSPCLIASRVLEITRARPFFGSRVSCEDGFCVYRNYGWLWGRFIHEYVERWTEMGFTLFGKYVLERGKPDLVHAHNSIYAGALARKIKQEYGIPYVITEHSTRFTLEDLNEKELQRVGDIYADADALVVVSPSLGRVLEEKIKKPSIRWHWIPNLIDPYMQALVSHSDASQEALKKDRKINILCISNLTLHKGVAILINAISMLIPKYPIYLKVIGSGEEIEQLEKVKKEKHLDEYVDFLGYLGRDSIQTEISLCDFLVHPSLYETFGVVIIEALAFGKPVVSTKCGGPECIIHERNGILVPTNDVESLSKAIESMIESYSSYNPELIQKDCIERFGWQKVSEQLTNLYDQVIA